jgi:hypothetical protein
MSTDEYKGFKYGGYATATVEVEVSVRGSWGGECSVAQIHSQATDEAESVIRGLAKEGVRIVGKPKIKAVIAVRE